MNPIRVAIRFDDPSETSRHDIEEAVIASLTRYGLPATFAVIPFRPVGQQLQALSPASAAHMQAAHKAGVIEIAQHGYSHKDWTSGTDGVPSEFFGRPISEQQSDVGAGLVHLHALFAGAIGGFVPPWNRYDAAASAAIRESGFRYVSSELGARLETHRLLSIPLTCQIADLKVNIQSARHLSALGPVIVAVMHHYNFHESGSDNSKFSLAQFDELLAWLAEQADVKVHTLEKLGLDHAEAIQRGVRLHQLKRRLHWRVQARLPRYCLITAPWWRVIDHVVRPPA
ncbi:MAG: DUF2334 domain-containing protein [Thiobacillaceae bacterium]